MIRNIMIIVCLAHLMFTFGCTSYCPPDEGPGAGGYYAYECYIDKWKDELRFLEKKLRLIQQEQKDLIKEQNILIQQKKQLHRIEKHLNEVSGIINQYEKGTQQAQKKERSIRQKIKRLKSTIHQNNNSKNIIEARNREISKLKKELEALMEISIALY